MNKGKLITLEGIEGVGKSSNLQFIATLLQQAGKPVVLTREPGGTPMAEDIRKILLAHYQETILPETELLLLYAGRLQHLQSVIKPALLQGKWVICDRFIDATFAYQGAGRQFPLEKIESLNKWAIEHFLPDCTILLDAPVKVAFERIYQQRKLDRFEQETQDFFERVRENYLLRAKLYTSRYRVIDATQPLLAVQTQIQAIIQEFIHE